MRKKYALEQMPSTQMVERANASYLKQHEALVAQIDQLQALLKAERLKSAKLEFQLQQVANSSQAA